VFCTATQPSLEKFFPSNIQFTELTTNPKELYDFYRRVEVKNLNVLTDEELLKKLNAHEQVLCIVNTRRHAKGLYDQLESGGSFHLSTLMCPAHREQTLKEIRQSLKNGQPCRVISTQVMEAGIDVDFPVGYRSLAGLDSIIQAAGRVNREMKKNKSEMFVFNPKTEYIKRTPIFIMQTAAVAENILRSYAADPTAIEAIEAYYQMLYKLQDEQFYDAIGVMSFFEKGTDKPDFDFKTAAEKFKFIDQNTVPIIIPFDENATLLISELQYVLYPGRILRQLQTYTVNVYEMEFEKLQSLGAIHTVSDLYNVLDKDQMEKYYHPKTGLVLPETSSGEAIFFD
jgi:CRISPR-associated endonuclease/helicase Cas3